MYIVSASSIIKCRNLRTSKLLHSYEPCAINISGPVRSISWSRNSNLLAVVPHTGQTEILCSKDKVKMMQTVLDVKQPTCVAFQNITEKLLALGTKDDQIVIYDLKAGSVKTEFTRTLSPISHIQFTAEDKHVVASCAKNGDILLYNNITSNLSHKFNIPNSESVTALQTNPIKSNLIMAGSKEGSIAVWDNNVNEMKCFMDAQHKSPITSVAFSPIHSDVAISTGLYGQFRFYDVEKHICIASLAVENRLMAVNFSKDGTHFCMASQDGIVYIYDARKIIKPVQSFQAHNEAIGHLSFQDAFNGNVSADSTSMDDCFLEFLSDTPEKSLDPPGSSELSIIRTQSAVKDDSPKFDVNIPEEDHLEVPNVELSPSLLERRKLEPLSTLPIPSSSKNDSNTFEFRNLVREVVREEIHAGNEKIIYHLNKNTEQINKLQDLIRKQRHGNAKYSNADWSDI